MWRPIGYLVLTVSVFTGLQRAFGAQGEYGDGPALVREKNPQIKSLANRDTRVYGVFWNLRDSFCYSGGTQGLNEFLRDFGALKNSPRRIIIHPGRAPEVRSMLSKKSVSYDWRMECVLAEKVGEEAKGLQRIVMGVHVWLGGNVKLNELEVPTSIEVKSGGEIEKFIAEHAARRKKAEGQE